MISIRRVPTTLISHVEKQVVYGHQIAWLVIEDGRKVQLFRHITSETGRSMEDALFAIEKQLHYALLKLGKHLTRYNTESIKNFKNWREQGLSIKIERDAPNSLPYFKAAVDQDSRDSWSWQDLAIILEQNDDVAGSINAFSKALELMPNVKMAARHLMRLAGPKHPAFALIKQNSFLVRNQRGIGFIVGAIATVMGILSAFLLISALFMPEMLVAGSDWPVPDFQGRLQFGVVSGILLFVANFLVAIIIKHPLVSSDKDNAQFLLLHFFGQFIMIGIAFMRIVPSIFLDGLKMNISVIHEMNANLYSTIIFGLIIGILPLYISIAAFADIFKGMSSDKFDLRLRDVGINAGRAFGSLIVFTMVVWLCFDIGGMVPPLLLLFTAGGPFIFSLTTSRTRKPIFKFLPGMLCEIGMILLVVMDSLFILYLVAAIGSILAMIWVEFTFGRKNK